MLKLSPSNEKIKYIKKLSRRSFREKAGEFIIEGRRAVIDAEKNGAQISHVIYCESDEKLFSESVKQFSVDKKIFFELTDTESPQDMLAVARAKTATAEQIFSHGCKRIIYCDRVQDPGNLGTIIRTADAAGDSAVVLSSGCVDLFNPKVIRSTMSSVFNVMIAKDEEFDGVLTLCRKNGYKTVCGALRDSSVNLFSADFPEKCVIIIGNEGSGASDEIIAESDLLVKIPMNGKAESLNASVSAGILIYEHLRQNG